MNKLKVMTIFGTRPEAIKMAPLVKALDACDEIESVVCVTAQHRQMLDQVLDIFKIKPDFDLDVMENRQTLVGITTRALDRLDAVMKESKPDIVLVHGDTTTTFVGSLAAFYNQIAVGHVEAGLRTFNKYFPYPEEVNRKLTGVIADMHFAPTQSNKNNLLREAVDESTIYVTGNTVIDALATTVNQSHVFATDILNKIDFKDKKVIVVTAHRRENLGEPLRNICTALKQIVIDNPDVLIVYPVHLNPAVQGTAESILGGMDRVHLIPPLDVVELHNLMARAYMVMTDSGGLQEEAPSLGKPVLVLRNETERPEAVEAGTVKISGTQYEDILRDANLLIRDSAAYDSMAHATNPYGDGHASERIVQALLARDRGFYN